MLANVPDGSLGEVLGRFKSHTSKKLFEMIANNARESRREWMIILFAHRATFVATNGRDSFGSQAAKGSVHVEFDVSKNSLLQGGRSDWMKGVGPGANASMRNTLGKQGGEMLPQVSNIKVIKTK